MSTDRDLEQYIADTDIYHRDLSQCIVDAIFHWCVHCLGCGVLPTERNRTVGFCISEPETVYG